MKFFAGFLVAMAVTVAWQTSVLSGEGTSPAMQEAIDAVKQENAAAGRDPIDPGDCD